MPNYESFHQAIMLIVNEEIPAFKLGALAATLLLMMKKEGETRSNTAYMATMRVAACLKKQQADEVTSNFQAREVIRKARGG